MERWPSLADGGGLLIRWTDLIGLEGSNPSRSVGWKQPRLCKVGIEWPSLMARRLSTPYNVAKIKEGLIPEDYV